MKLVQFYRGEIPNNEGVFIDEILAYSYGALEDDHAYIQWILPLKERSMFNTDAPLLTDKEIELFAIDPELKTKVYSVAYKMIDFYGMYIHGSKADWQESDDKHGHKDPKWWLRRFNHNFLRITRMLRSLRYLGCPELSEAIYECLMKSRDMFEVSSYEYWTEAVAGPLP